MSYKDSLSYLDASCDERIAWHGTNGKAPSSKDDPGANRKNHVVKQGQGNTS